jgi:hypothetical protein
VHRARFFIFVFHCLLVTGLTLWSVSCHRGKGLAGENSSTYWTLELEPHPDTIAVGVNDTIFVAVREGDELRGGITVTFEQTLGDPVPSVITVVGDTAIWWGTAPMATFISRQDTGLAMIHGTAYGSAQEILARDTARIQVVESP